MQQNCYLYHLAPTSKVLTLSNKREKPSVWNLRIDGEVIGCEYNDPHQAALDVSRADFEEEKLADFFTRVKVPSDLNMWQPCHTNRKVNICYD